MHKSTWLAGAAIALLAIGGCDKAQTPKDVQHDVTSAANTAADKNAQASEKQGEVASAANRDVGNAAADAAVTEAEGIQKVALARCESQAGDARKACTDEADAALAMARARAKAMRAGSG